MAWRLVDLGLCRLAATVLLCALTVSGISRADPQAPAESFMTASASTLEPYVGEAVVYKLDFFTRLKILPPAPVFVAEGFTEYTLEQSRRTELRRGISYSSVSLRMLLFPDSEGPLTIPAQVVDLSPFVMASEEQQAFTSDPGRFLIRSEPITLNVKPLPPVPAELGQSVSQVIVGSAEVRPVVDVEPLQIGITRQLKIVVRSTGNIGPLRFDVGASSGLLAYEGSPQLEVSSSSNPPTLEKTFTWTLVPVQKGNLRIRPEGPLVFDPRKETYENLPLSPVAFKVVSALTGSQARSSNKNAASRILQYREPNAMEQLVDSVSVSSALLVLCVLLLTAVTVYVHLNARAWRMHEKKHLVVGVRDAEGVAYLSQSFRLALCELLGAAEQPAEGLRELLKLRLTDDELRRSVESFLQDAATALYSQKELSARKLKEMKHRAATLLEEIHEAVEE